MQNFKPAILVALTGCLMAVFFVALAYARFDPCVEPPDAKWTPPIASFVNAPVPTLAPAPAAITVRVQSDCPDFEIRWAEN